MSIHHIAVMHCDWDGCPEGFHAGDALASAVREMAAEAGWTRPKIDGKRVDWCDRHGPEAGEAPTTRSTEPDLWP